MSARLQAGWLGLVFNGSLAVPRSVCTGKASRGQGLRRPGSGWAAVPVETQLAASACLWQAALMAPPLPP